MPKRAASARSAPACRRKVPSPGPISSTAPGPARTASSTLSIAIHRIRPRASTAPPRPSRARVFGRSIITDIPLRFWPQSRAGRTALRRQGDAVLGLSGRSRRAVDFFRFALQLSAQPVQAMAIIAAFPAWARPTCSAPTALTSISPRMGPHEPRTKMPAGDAVGHRI